MSGYEDVQGFQSLQLDECLMRNRGSPSNSVSHGTLSRFEQQVQVDIEVDIEVDMEIGMETDMEVEMQMQIEKNDK